jgi:hypothetical protein
MQKMEICLIKDLENKIGQNVMIYGLINDVKDLKTVQFIIIRDESGKVQAVSEKNVDTGITKMIASITQGSMFTVSIEGKVVKNKRAVLGGIEIQIEKIWIDSMAENWRISGVKKAPSGENFAGWFKITEEGIETTYRKLDQCSFTPMGYNYYLIHDLSFIGWIFLNTGEELVHILPENVPDECLSKLFGRILDFDYTLNLMARKAYGRVKFGDILPVAYKVTGNTCLFPGKWEDVGQGFSKYNPKYELELIEDHNAIRTYKDGKVEFTIDDSSLETRVFIVAIPEKEIYMMICQVRDVFLEIKDKMNPPPIILEKAAKFLDEKVIEKIGLIKALRDRCNALESFACGELKLIPLMNDVEAQRLGGYVVPKFEGQLTFLQWIRKMEKGEAVSCK